ncbi:MAG TPA: sortase [Chloroflexia bacterium]|nr:sortase [Chloroflexia bacterium]
MALLLVPLGNTALAAEVPPANNPYFIQTNGPDAPITQGDWYTGSTNGVNGGYHYVAMFVPCGWPSSLPIAVDLFSAAMNSTGNQFDELFGNNVAFNTTFELYGPYPKVTPSTALPGPNGPNSLIQKTYVPTANSEVWDRLYTITTPVPCSTYLVRAETGGPNNNGWRIRVGTDNDNNPNNAPPANYDNPDGKAGTNDEITIGFMQIAYQHEQTNVTCLTLYQFVAPGSPFVSFHNFDMDSDANIDPLARVRYYGPNDAYDPNGLTGGTAGVPSTNGVWNGGTLTNRGTGDVINNPAGGWWRIVTCVSKHNQIIQEGQKGVPTFYSQPPTPVMTLTKDDGVTVTAPNDQLTYTLTFKNTSSGATAGAATNVVLTDTLPANVAYVSCAINAPYTGTCTPAGGTVTYKLDQAVNAGATGTFSLTVKVNPNATGTVVNTARLNYSDSLGNQFPPVDASDTDTIPVEGIPVMTISKDDHRRVTDPGTIQTYTLTFKNTSTGATAGTAYNVKLTDTLPSNATYQGCAINAPFTGTCTQTGNTVVYNITEPVDPGVSGTASVTVKVNSNATGTVVNTVQVTYTDKKGNPQTPASATDVDTLPTPTPATTPPATTPPVTTPPATTPPVSTPPASATPTPTSPSAVLGKVDPVITKVSDVSAASRGQTVKWTLTVTNPGSEPMTNTVITDNVPQPFVVQGATSSKGTVTVNGQSVRVNVGTLNGNEVVTVVITTVVGDGPGGTIPNTGVVTTNNGSGQSVSMSSVAAVLVAAMPNTGRAEINGGFGDGNTAYWWTLSMLAIFGAALVYWNWWRRAGILAWRAMSAPAKRKRLTGGFLVMSMGLALALQPFPIGGSDEFGDGRQERTSSVRADSTDMEMFGKRISTERSPLANALSSNLQQGTGPVVPYRIRIPALGIDTFVEDLGMRGAQMDVPSNIWNAGWINSSVRPGAVGNAVIDGHKDSVSGTAVFWNLKNLKPGDRIYVSDVYGYELAFEVTDVQAYATDQTPMSRVIGTSDKRNLNLVTCDGNFLPSQHTYDQRVVVYTEMLIDG